jgi:Carboxypeptidase regulatory-like domain/TonB dependent receptor-like, beta-barrel
MFRIRIFVLCGLGLALAGPITAQSPTGSLTGVVQDADGALLSTVELRAVNVATGYEYSSISEENGRYWLPGLPPGTYDVTATRIGIEPTQVTGVRLPVGRTLTLDVRVALTAVQVEGLRVVAAPRLAASTQADVAFGIDQEMIQRLPEETRSFMALAALAPGATVGSTTLGTSNFGSGISVGALNAHSLGVQIDGSDFTEPAFGDVSGGIPLLAIQEFEVIQTSYSAEMGRAASGIVNAVTRRGTNELDVEAFTLVRHSSLNAIGEFEDVKPDYDRLHWGFAVGGPIVRDQTHFFVAMERKTENNFVTLETGDARPGIDGTYIQPFSDNLLFARLDHRISESQEVTFRYSGEIGEKIAGIGTNFAGFLLGPDAGSKISTRMHGALLTHRWNLGGGLLNQARVHFIARDFDDNPVNSVSSQCYPSVCEGGGPEGGSQGYQRLEFIDDISTVMSGSSGTHRLKFGTQISRITNDTRFTSLANGAFVYDANDATDPFFALVGAGGFGPTSSNTQFGVFVQDEWNPTPSLTLNIGVRYEIETNGTGQGYVSPIAGDLPFVRTTPRPADKNNIAPRIGFAWDVDQRTIVRGGFGVFYDDLPSHPLDGLERSSGETGQSQILFPPTQDVDDLLQMFPPQPIYWPNAAELQTPMTRQYSVGVEREVTAGLSVRLDGLVVEARHVPIERQLNTTDPNTGPAYPGYGPLFQMLTQGTNETRMLMASAEQRFERAWVNVSYTLADRRNTNDSWNDFVFGPLDPDLDDFSALEGRAAWDERHRVVATGGADLPFGLALSGKILYSSRRPYTALTIADLNQDGVPNDRPPGEPRNAREGPDFFRVDAGAGWYFDMGASRQIGLQLNVYNLLNTTNHDPASIVTFLEAPDFGAPSVAFPKRVAEVGVSIR